MFFNVSTKEQAICLRESLLLLEHAHSNYSTFYHSSNYSIKSVMLQQLRIHTLSTFKWTYFWISFWAGQIEILIILDNYCTKKKKMEDNYENVWLMSPCYRKSFCAGLTLNSSQLAFFEPTLGEALISSYTRTSSFLVYTTANMH